MTDTVLAQETAGGRARAIRALLASPLLDRRAGNDFALVVQHGPWLQRWFDDKCGWVLTVDARHGFARLRKVPARPSAIRGARTSRSTPRPFTRRRYALFAVVAAVLSDTTRPQISLHDLVDRVRAVTAGHDGIPAFAPSPGAGVTAGQARHERVALVDAVTALVHLGVLGVVEARGDYGENETGNVLYDVDDRRLGHLIAAPRPPSLATSLRHMLHEDRYGPWTELAATAGGSDEEPHPVAGAAEPALRVRSLERARALAGTGSPVASGEQQRRQARHRIMRILLDDPVLYLDALAPAEREYLRVTIGQISTWVGETGMVLERRAEGWALIDPEDLATDIRFPEGNDLAKFAALLVLAALAPPGIPDAVVRHPRQAAELVIAARLRANPTWARAFQDADGAARLTDAALDLLVGLDLAEVDATGVTLLAAAGRYRPEVADVANADVANADVADADVADADLADAEGGPGRRDARMPAHLFDEPAPAADGREAT